LCIIDPIDLSSSSSTEDDLETLVAKLPSTDPTSKNKRKDPPSPQVASNHTKTRRVSGSQDGAASKNRTENQRGDSKDGSPDLDEDDARVPGAAFHLTFEFEVKVQTMTKGGKTRADKPQVKITRDKKIYAPFTLHVARISLTELRSKLASHTKQSSNEITWGGVDYRAASKAVSQDRTFPMDIPALNDFLAEMSRTRTKRCIVVWPPADAGKEASEEVEEVRILRLLSTCVDITRKRTLRRQVRYSKGSPQWYVSFPSFCHSIRTCWRSLTAYIEGCSESI
jgi:hypothetical protein